MWVPRPDQLRTTAIEVVLYLSICLYCLILLLIFSFKHIVTMTPCCWQRFNLNKSCSLYYVSIWRHVCILTAVCVCRLCSLLCLLAYAHVSACLLCYSRFVLFLYMQFIRYVIVHRITLCGILWIKVYRILLSFVFTNKATYSHCYIHTDAGVDISVFAFSIFSIFFNLDNICSAVCSHTFAPSERKHVA